MSTISWKDPETKIKFYHAIFASNETALSSGSGTADQVAVYMGCTAKAVTHQLTALRKEIDSLKSGNPQAPATPAKGKKRKNTAKNEEDGDASPTPGKKAKATPKKSAAADAKKGGKTKKKEEEEVVKEESSDDEGVDGENGVDGEDGKDSVAARKNAADGKEHSDEIED
ncbi:hypothetical protein LTR05_001885 [Lithohypha guttulata]|uniref:Uncharacterized protein n=1 Tax=Lithohypha guttulata TaxID=1690604 RepID=A0AAN7T8H0_9EURO|nr:hypothetical protein LTR05_001885 [Lithohypha guttulata]